VNRKKATAISRQDAGPDLRHRLPAKGQHHERAANLVTAAPTLPAPKMPSAVPCFSLREELGDIGDTDGERSAGHADAQGGDQELRIGLGVGQQEGRRRPPTA
jgi:hypothetical protein